MPNGNPRGVPMPLPQSRQELDPLRKFPARVNLNDLVEQAFNSLWDEEDFRNLFFAAYDEQSVHGWTVLDEADAALRVQKWAQDHAQPLLATAKQAVIIKSLRVVAKRYGLSRKERRNTVGGHYVQPDGENLHAE